jgi:hypothetical protein
MTPEDVPGRTVDVEDLFSWLLAVEPLLREPRRPKRSRVDDDREALPDAA